MPSSCECWHGATTAACAAVLAAAGAGMPGVPIAVFALARASGLVCLSVAPGVTAVSPALSSGVAGCGPQVDVFVDGVFIDFRQFFGGEGEVLCGAGAV